MAEARSLTTADRPENRPDGRRPRDATRSDAAFGRAGPHRRSDVPRYRLGRARDELERRPPARRDVERAALRDGARRRPVDLDVRRAVRCAPVRPPVRRDDRLGAPVRLRGRPRIGRCAAGSAIRSSKVEWPFGHLGIRRPFSTRTFSLQRWQTNVPVFQACSPA
jgi:hypothetical protein